MVLKPRYLVALATLLAFGLAGVQLDHEPFWLDEFTTRQWAQLPFAEIRAHAGRRYHPPLYFWFMHGWLRVGPPADEVWMRLPSVLFFGLTVPMVYLVGRTLGGSSRAGVYAAFLAATAPFLLHYGQEARSYAMLTFFAACGFAAVARIMCRWRDKACPRLIGTGLIEACGLLARGRLRDLPQALRDDGAWAAYIVSSVVVMLLHNTAGVFPAVTGLMLLCAIGTAPSHRGVRFVSLCIAMGLIALLYSPQIPYLLSGMGRVSLFYVQIPDVDGVVQTFRQVYGGNSGVSLTLLTLLAMIAMTTWVWNRRWERTAFALLGWLLAPALLIAFSFWKPILQSKLLIWTLVPFLAAGAAGLALVPWSFVRAAALAALLVFHLQGVAREWRSVTQDWRSVSRIIARDASPDAAVLICFPWHQHVFSHYWERERRFGLPLHLVDASPGRQEVLEIDGSSGGRGLEVDPAKLLAQYPQVWLIWVGGCRGKLNFLTTALEQQGRLVQEWKPTGVHLRWYDRSE